MFKINPNESNPVPIKRMILYTDSPQLISIKEDDVEELIKDAEVLQACARYGKSVEDAIQRLSEEKELFENAKKAILVIRIGGSYNPDMTEMFAINKVVANFPDSCNVKWGISKSSDPNYNVALVCAVAKSKNTDEVILQS